MPTLPFFVAVDLGLLAAAGAGAAWMVSTARRRADRVVAAAHRQADRIVAAAQREAERDKPATIAPPPSPLSYAEADRIPIVYRRRVEPPVRAAECAQSGNCTVAVEDTAAIQRAVQLDFPLAGPLPEAVPALVWTEAATAEESPAAVVAVPSAPGSLSEPVLMPGDLYADPIDGTAFEAGETIVLCACGTGYRPATREWLLEHAGGACVQCQRLLPAAFRRLASITTVLVCTLVCAGLFSV